MFKKYKVYARAFFYASALVMVLSAQEAAAQKKEAGWVSLFNGKDLKGWKQLNGSAKYEVVDGAIVGTSVANTPNSFLTTEKNYGDFIFECDVQVDDKLNSGIQFRSLSKPDYRDGRVHGYQCEIDPSDRAWSGGIYDEARRGWLYPLDGNPEGRKAFKRNAWNHYRIEAIGNTIRTFVNGIQTAHLIDDLTPSGFICLQVHSIPNAELAGTQVKWRNIRIKTTGLQPKAVQKTIHVVNLIPNTLNEVEEEQGFKLLFDGKNADQWRGYKQEGLPAGRWDFDNGAITIAKKNENSKGGGDLITKEKFGPVFDFKFEFRLTEGANSGIKYFIEELPDKGSGLGPEYQVLDDEKHPDAKNGVVGNRTLASLYDLIPAEKPKNSLKPIGEWNSGRIVAFSDGTVQHFLNEQKVVEYKRGSAIWKALVARSKFKDEKDFGLAPAGHLLLQDHSDQVSFRSLRVKQGL
ncbi:DUF1080 domain-containing protein [Ravibacter arvi]|uniref:DUF1080 domain-containing protein n=1 Tax=Ravibacter arvi TaxID=2051041 RepID=A0ABP8MC29_9BACT